MFIKITSIMVVLSMAMFVGVRVWVNALSTENKVRVGLGAYNKAESIGMGIIGLVWAITFVMVVISLIMIIVRA